MARLVGQELRHCTGESYRRHNFIPIIPYTFEEIEWFLQPVLIGVFAENHIIAAAGGHEYDGSHVIETLNPFSALIPLSSDVEHTVRHNKLSVMTNTRHKTFQNSLEVNFFHLEFCFEYSWGEDTTSKDILFWWGVVRHFNDMDPV